MARHQNVGTHTLLIVGEASITECRYGMEHAEEQLMANVQTYGVVYV